MRLSPLLLALLCAACWGEDPPKDAADSVVELQDSLADDSSPADDSAASDDSAAADDTGECADEGEACEVFEDGWSSTCCNSRHTCFPEGCYYSQP